MTSPGFFSDSDAGGRGIEHAPVPLGAGAILVLRGGSDRQSVTLGRDKPLFHLEFDAPVRTNALLAESVRRALAAHDLAPADLAGIACERGPGGFTALRVNLALAEGLALAAGIPLAGLDSLDLMALDACGSLNRPVLALGHARRNLVYAQPFAANAGQTGLPPVPLGPPEVLDLEAAAAALVNGPPDMLAVGPGLRNNAAFFEARLPRDRILPPQWDRPRPEVLLAAALRAAYRHDSIRPAYLRPSDAEENLAHVAALSGLSAGEAARRLASAMAAPPVFLE